MRSTCCCACADLSLPAFIARRLPQSAYSNRIGKGLDAAYRSAEPRPPVDLNDLRAVVFSDHHRGRGDGADDFRRCEESYAAALGWYLEQDYELCCWVTWRSCGRTGPSTC